MDIRDQLEHLRQTIGQINARYAPPSRAAGEASAASVADALSGRVVTTPLGSHLETETVFDVSHRHGSFEVSALAELPGNLLEAISGGSILQSAPKRWAFLDTETTGLAGGSGTYAFLVGVGIIEETGFRVRQFFMRDYSEEASLLHSLSEFLKPCDVLITYNGRSYDQPLLETRYTMCRARHPFSRMEHVDLLYGARRLFKLRLESCRLANLEDRILGYERQGDIPGEMIPYCYFEYLRTGRTGRLQPILRHNVLDILSLACLTGLIPDAFRDPLRVKARHGMDLLGLARWLQLSGRLDESLQLLRRAIEMGMPDEHLFSALFTAGQIEKKQGQHHAAVATFTDLSLSPNPFRVRAYEELAMHYEHRERSYSMAIECVRAAREIADSPELRKRHDRLEARAARTTHQRRLRIPVSVL